MNVSRTGYSDPYALNTLPSTTAVGTVGGTGSDTQSGSSAPGMGATTHQRRAAGGGPMGDAMVQALQSMGITVPPPPAAGTGSGNAASNASVPGVSSTATDGTPIDLRKDMGDLMHALFQAVKEEGGTTSAATYGTPPGSSDGASSFASGLSSLISQAANGTAPTDLQTAFKTLTTDLQSLNGGAGASTGGSGSTAATASGGEATSTDTASLQAFLSKLQDNLGYGAAGRGASTSNLVNSVA